MPSLVSGNWAGAGLALFIFFIAELLLFWRWGWPRMKKERIESIGIGVAAVAAGWLLLFCCSVVNTTYQKHVALRSENQRLNAELNQRANHGLSLRIGGLVMGGFGKTTTAIQLTVTAYNDGEPTTVHDWKMTVHRSNGDLSSVYLPGGGHLFPLKDSPNLQRLDERLENPLNRGVEVHGLVTFLIKNVPIKQFWHLMDDPNAAFVLSVVDSYGRTVHTERSFPEMAAEYSTHIKR